MLKTICLEEHEKVVTVDPPVTVFLTLQHGFSIPTTEPSMRFRVVWPSEIQLIYKEYELFSVMCASSFFFFNS